MNETLGDQLFDLLLMQFTRRLRAATDDSVTIACLRSNEFGLLIPVTSGVDHPARIVREIVTALESPFVIGDGLRLEVQVSFGIALFPEHANSADLLLQRSRAALAEARLNRRVYDFYSGEKREGLPALIDHRLTSSDRSERAIFRLSTEGRSFKNQGDRGGGIGALENILSSASSLLIALSHWLNKPG